MSKSIKRPPTPKYRTAPIEDAAKVLNTTVDEIRSAIASGKAVGVHSLYSESVRLVLLPGETAPQLAVPA